MMKVVRFISSGHYFLRRIRGVKMNEQAPLVALPAKQPWYTHPKAWVALTVVVVVILVRHE
jgi:hypothetical protein